MNKPLRAAVVLSGGQAPGGHNVIGGLYNFVKDTGGTLFGFTNGPKGIMTGEYVELSDEIISEINLVQEIIPNPAP